ncbi:MAG: HAD hydrolase family protein [Kiritimatiellaeota bacterium]|nr:HAD hydrolase family protein [Kiritimatiellota bacterium]
MTYEEYISTEGDSAMLGVKALLLDIDGVLTDARFGYDGTENEIKFFHARDGHGIKLALRSGLKVGMLSGRASGANRKRAGELGLSFFYEGEKDKLDAFQRLLAESGLKAADFLYVGDDLVDVPVFKMTGVSATVADAPDYMDEYCDFRTTLPGGHGAVREIVERILKGQNRWSDVAQKYIA